MDVFSRIFELIQSGGFVAWPLLLSMFILWYCVLKRYGLIQSIQRSEFKTEIQALVDKKYSREQMELRLNDHRSNLSSHKVLVNLIVVIAPLLGLLGTVHGMIETFASLGGGSLYTQDGGIAGGISEALVSTQLGLSVAIPGLVASRLLIRMERKKVEELEGVKDQILGVHKKSKESGE